MQVSIMHGSVIRGDLNNIKIGYFTTIQENCVIHAARYALPTSHAAYLVTCAAGGSTKVARSGDRT